MFSYWALRPNNTFSFGCWQWWHYVTCCFFFFFMFFSSQHDSLARHSMRVAFVMGSTKNNETCLPILRKPTFVVTKAVGMMNLNIKMGQVVSTFVYRRHLVVRSVEVNSDSLRAYGRQPLPSQQIRKSPRWRHWLLGASSIMALRPGFGSHGPKS